MCVEVSMYVTLLATLLIGIHLIPDLIPRLPFHRARTACPLQ